MMWHDLDNGGKFIKECSDCIEFAEIENDYNKETGKYAYCIKGCTVDYDYNKTLKENREHYDLQFIDQELHDIVREYMNENGKDSVKIHDKVEGCDGEEEIRMGLNLCKEN